MLLFFPLHKEQSDEIIKKLGNIARHNLIPPISLEHTTLDFNGNSLLFIHIPANIEKPVYMRNGTIYDSYRRSAGQTVKMSRQEVKQLIAESQGLLFHEQTARTNVTADEVLNLLDYSCYFRLSSRTLPETKTAILETLAVEKFIAKQNENWNITNLGALLFAYDLTKFRLPAL